MTPDPNCTCGAVADGKWAGIHSNECTTLKFSNNFAVVPLEPTREIIEALYGPWLSVTAHESRIDAYKAAIAIAVKGEET